MNYCSCYCCCCSCLRKLSYI